MPQIGDVIDMKIDGQPRNTHIVGEVIGVRQSWTNADILMVQVKNVDLWIDLDDKVDWELIK